MLHSTVAYSVSSQLSLGRLVFLNSLMPFLFMIIATLITAFILLPILRRLNVGQQVRDDGPKSHEKKSGTPTFGGIMFILPLLLFGVFFPLMPINEFLLIEGHMTQMTVMAVFTSLIGVVGFIDDYIKVRKNKKGLSPSLKSVLLLSVIILYTLYYLYFSGEQPFFFLPFTDITSDFYAITVSGAGKILYGVVIVFVLYATANAVNITDGIDGLASIVSFFAAFTVGVLGSVIASDMTRSAGIFAFAISAGCIVFFLFNKYPAKLFMGDTGSQALGAGIAASAIFMGLFWVLILVGIVYVIESLSVIIQVGHYKRTGRRIFEMAPLHHHFELKGWSEWKIIVVFSIITLGGCISALLIIL